MPAIPVIALTGYLGAGKTSLLNHVLQARFGNGAAVTFGAELGGFGSSVQIWTFRGQASLPFSAR